MSARDGQGRFAAPVRSCPACGMHGPHHRCLTGLCVHCDACGHGYHPRPPGAPILTDGHGRPIVGDAVADVANRAFDRQFRRSLRGST